MKKIVTFTILATFAITAKAQNAEQILNRASSLGEEKNYTEAIALLRNSETVFTQESALSYMYGQLSWYYLFTKDFNLSEQAVHKALEADSTQTWVKTNLAHTLLFQGKTAEAEEIYNELANTLLDEDEDEADTYTAILLNDFDQLENAGIVPPNSKNDFERIKAHIEKINEAIEIYKQFEDLWLEDEYDEALTLLQPCIATLPEQHAQWVINVVGNKGYKYYNLGNYTQAVKYFLELKTIIEKVLGKDHSDYASSISNLGVFYSRMGNYAEAEKYWLEAKTICEQILGTKHPDYVRSLVNLGGLYHYIGSYIKAEIFYLETKTIWEEILGKENLDYVSSLNNLGGLYNDMGDYAQAEKYYLETKTIQEKILGKDHPDYVRSLYNLGTVYFNMNDYPKAEILFCEVKPVWKAVMDTEHPDYATFLNKLGSVYNIMGNYFQSEACFLEAKSIQEKVIGKDHPAYSITLNNLGLLYSNLGDYPQAETYYLEALKVFRGVRVEDTEAIQLDDLSFFYLKTKKIDQAQAMKIKADQILMPYITRSFTYLSGIQRSRLWDKYKNNFEASYSIAHNYSAGSMVAHVYNNTLFTKGLLLRTTNGIRDAIYSSGDNDLIGKYEQLGEFTQKISALRTKETPAQDMIRILEAHADSLDKALTVASRAYRDFYEDNSMKWQNIRDFLQPGEAAVEFVHFCLYDTKWTDTTMYAALVLRPGMEAPAWIPLCEEKDLQTYFDKAKGALNDELKTNRLYNIFGAELYNLIWQPLEKELNDVKTVYYSPSGLLHKVAFDAIPVDSASRLFDRYEMKLVSSTREIRRLKEAKVDTLSNATVLYGGITYDTDSVSLKNEAALYPQSQQTVAFTVRGSAGAMEPWKTLEGSQREMEQIAAQLNRHQIEHTTFTGIAGNEESFKSLSGKNTNQIIISTHGFFLEDIKKDNNADLIRRLGGGGSQKPFENPLLRSGLVMAGGNRVWTGQPPIEGIEDGILTADEISQLNLISTRLVVLSACQTGLGEVRNSEGVFGLQRAFKLAGVESLIMSLWEVNDTATQIMMSTFYENWLGGKTKQEAFRLAQKAVREYAENDYSSPYYWAAFVMMD